MVLRMSESTADAFLERISATAIVNQAILKCSLAGLPVTSDNVVRLIGDFMDPEEPQFESLSRQIDATIDDIFDTAELISGALKRKVDGGAH